MARAALAPTGVTFVSSHALLGGSERYLELLLGCLGPEWIRGVVSLQEGPFVDRLRSLGHPVEVVPTPARTGMLLAAARVRRVLARQRPDVVHANGVKAALVAALATTGTRTPVIWVKHDFSWDGRLAQLVAWRCAQVVAVSGAVAAAFGPRLGRRVHVVPNGIPETGLDRAAGRRLVDELVEERGEALVAIVLGRLHHAKGQLELIEAATKVLERRPDARFLIVGGEDPAQRDYAELLRRRVRELRLEWAVTFVGHRQDALELLSGCDVAVVPSVQDERGYGREGFGLVLLEAMEAGTPLVAYADGAVPEVMGGCGRLVPPGDRTALAAAIVELMDDDEERQRVAGCGRERVRTHFRLEPVAAAMMERYRDAAAG